MERIDVPSAVAVMPAPAALGTPGYFTRGNPGPGTPVPATSFDPDWCNNIQEEIISVLGAAAIATDKTSITQLLTAIKSLIQSGVGGYAADTGAANAYVVALSPVLGAHKVGMPIRVLIAHPNTGASTFNPGPGFKNIKTLAGNDPPAGALKGIVELVYDGTEYLLMGFFGRGSSFSGASQFNYTGYSIDENGIIDQWGSVSAGGGAFTFPLAFPNACFICIGQANQSPPGLTPGTATITGNGYPASNTTGQAFTSNVAYVASWFAKGN